MTATEYFDLVDKSGRFLRSDKRGAIDADLAPILLRIGANPEAWIDTVSRLRIQIPPRSRSGFQSAQFCRSARPTLALRALPRLEPPLQSRHRNRPEPYSSIRPSSADPARSSDPIDRFQHHLTISMPETALQSATLSICLTHWSHPFPLSLIASSQRSGFGQQKS